MKGLSLANIASACGGTYRGSEDARNREITGVAIDSRKIEKDFLFVPIKGARVDGHDFIEQVMEKEALCTLSEHPLTGAQYPYILVNSTEQALKDLAHFYRSQLDLKVIGITGSVGKTSTKELIASVLEQKYRVLKTEGNYNNEIGLPLTIFRLTEEDEIAVLEMGIDHFGEMHRLADIARPNVCVITNIGYAHLENLGSREGILQAKTEMFEHLQPEFAVVLNGDDDMLRTVADVHGQKPVFFGIDSAAPVFASHIENRGLKGTLCTIQLPACGDFSETTIQADIPIPGKHMVYNALAGAYIGHLFGLSPEEIETGIHSLQPVTGRNHLIETDTLMILDDCYNANPASMRASLDVLALATGRRVAVMGNMKELGENEEQLHFETGEYAARKGIDTIVCIGPLACQMYLGAKNLASGNTVLHYTGKEEFLHNLPSLFEAGDTVLVKASNSMKFSEIVEALTEFEANTKDEIEKGAKQ